MALLCAIILSAHLFLWRHALLGWRHTGDKPLGAHDLRDAFLPASIFITCSPAAITQGRTWRATAISSIS
jgi:hypothetical protein